MNKSNTVKVKHNFWHRQSDGKFNHYVSDIINGTQRYFTNGKLIYSCTETCISKNEKS